MELNFFEPLLREIKPEKQDKSKFIVAASLALFLAFVGTTLGYNFLETKKLNDEIAEADQFFNDDSIRVKVEEIDRKLAEISDIKLKEEYLSYLKQDMKNIDVINDRLLDFISKEVVKDLIIQELLIEKGAVTLQGISLTKLGIAQFEHDLRNSGHFYGIFVPKIEIEEGGFYRFEMSFDTVVGGQ